MLTGAGCSQFTLVYTGVTEKAVATHSSPLAWKIPWTEEPGRLQSLGSRRVGHDWVTSVSLFSFMHWRRKWQHTPVFLSGDSQGRGSLVGCRLWGCTESDTMMRLSSSSSIRGWNHWRWWKDTGSRLSCCQFQLCHFLLAVVALSKLPNLLEPQYPPWKMRITEPQALTVLEVDLRDIMALVPDLCNKGNSAIKEDTQLFFFHLAVYISFVHTIL